MLVGKYKSGWRDVLSGTTQGTVLGFLLFLIYINDLPESCSPLEPDVIQLLADDTKSFQEIRHGAEHHTEDHNKLQDRIDAIASWAEIWKMVLHPEKAKILHVGDGNPRMGYTLGGETMKVVEEEKDPGSRVSCQGHRPIIW